MTPKHLKHTSAAERLAIALESFRQPQIVAYARTAALSSRHTEQAIRGRLQATVPYLRLAAAIGHDPLRDAMPWPLGEVTPVGDFDFVMLAMGLRLRRGLNHHTDQDAATAMGLGVGFLRRLEQAAQLTIGPVLRACRYAKVHPFGYIRQPEKIGQYARDRANVSRETLPPGDREAAPLGASVHGDVTRGSL
jgi:hypothetical protein